MERSGIEVNTKQKLFGYPQNLVLPGDRVLDLECNGRSFYLVNRAPSKEELHAWRSCTDRCYQLTARGSHIVQGGMLVNDAYRTLRLQWTEPKLAEWQKRFCFHSSEAIKKTFEQSTQLYQSIAYENQLFPTHSFQ
jgi:hypothetical protein